MPKLVGTFGLNAGLALLATAWLLLGAKLPEPYRDMDGGNAIIFALLIYFITLLSLVLGTINRARVREAFRSRYRVLFGVSASVVVAYFLFVSFTLYGLSQAKDL
jgi:uncharacterized membrane protein YidH (DUF202 family)